MKVYDITLVKGGKLYRRHIHSDEDRLINIMTSIMSIRGIKTISELLEHKGFNDYFIKCMEFYEGTNENPSLEWIIESWMVKSREDKLNSLLDDK